MTNEQSAAYYGNLARVAAGFAISCDSDTEALAAYLYAVQAARYARYASLFTSPMKPATICPICHARTSTPATLPDGSVVCQLCGVEATEDCAPPPPPGLARKPGVDYGCGDSACDRCYEPEHLSRSRLRR